MERRTDRGLTPENERRKAMNETIKTLEDLKRELCAEYHDPYPYQDAKLSGCWSEGKQTMCPCHSWDRCPCSIQCVIATMRGRVNNDQN